MMTDESNIRPCRACLNANYRKSVSLNEKNWMEIFYFCLNIEISDCDINLTLCVKCSHILKRYAEFKKQCQQSELFWKSLLQKEVKCILNLNESTSEFLNELNITTEDEMKIEDEEQKNDNTHEDEVKIEKINEDIELFDEPEYLDEFATTDNRIEPEYSFKCETKEQVIHSKILQDSKVVTINRETETSIKILKETINSNKTVKNFLIGSCNKCGKVYKKKRCFLKHIQSCEWKKKSNENPSESYLEGCLHKKIGEGKCMFCENNKKNTQIKRFKGICEKCNRVLTSKDLLIKHVKKCTNLKVKLPFCGLCDHKPESGPWDETAHLRQHYDNNDLECKLCSFTGKDFAQMISHRYVHHPIGPVGTDEYIASSSVCILCSKKDRKPRLAEYHFRKVHLKSEGGRCCHCDKKLTLMKHWRNHERAHVVRGPDCPLCGRNFKYKSSLKYHMSCYHRSERLVCDYCGKLFIKKSCLQNHISRVHSSVSAVKCDHCEKLFKSEICLQIHLAYVAKGKTKSCPLCPKTFYNNSALKVHMPSHSEKRSYKCKLCEKSFKYASHLVVHTKIHMGNFNYKCKECDSAFATSSQLKRHMSVHTGVRRHKCSCCDKSFYSPSMLRDHCIKRHQIDLNSVNKL